MDDERVYFVYIMASHKRVLYIGITNNLERRVWEHQHDVEPESFCARYSVHKLVYFVRFASAKSAIAREKEIKRWRREKKIALIEPLNPRWRDLSREWGKPIEKLPIRFAETGSSPSATAVESDTASSDPSRKMRAR